MNLPLTRIIGKGATPILALLSLTSSTPAFAENWRERCGYLEWQLATGRTIESLGSGVPVSQIEPDVDAGLGFSYLPQASNGTTPFSGSGDFAGKTFTPKSYASSASWHAADAAACFYGNSTGAAPGLTMIANWEGAHFLNNVVGTDSTPNTTVQLAEVTSKIQSNAWVAYDPGGSADTFASILCRFDYLVNQKNMLVTAGVNNGATSTVPPLLCSSYNTLSCGVSSGDHSHGGTLADFGAAGRMKPELVAPLSNTSRSTGAIAGMAAALSSRADDGDLGANANDARVLHAILLSGATKHEFPDWSHTETKPIDETHGAGEANLAYSWKILTAGTQPSSNAAPCGWAFPTVSAHSTKSYTLALPNHGTPADLIASVVWHRKVKAPKFEDDPYAYEPLEQITLEALDASGQVLQRSISPIDNFQHLFLQNLGSGQSITLRITSNSDQSIPVAIAWRSYSQPQTAIHTEGQAIGQFNFTRLIPGAICRVERSTDLTTWETIHTFTASTTSQSWTDPAPLPPPIYYQVRFATP